MHGEGPQVIASQHQTCSLCKYHDQRMYKSGRNPEYDHYCKHLDSPRSRLAFWLESGTAWIGKSDTTPKWCPYLTPAR